MLVKGFGFFIVGPLRWLGVAAAMRLLIRYAKLFWQKTKLEIFTLGGN